MTRVFFSYSASDRALADKLKKAFQRHGAQTFDPFSDLTPGESISETLLTHLRRSDLFVFVAPRFEGQGKSALVELGAARALGKRIVTVVPDEARAASHDKAVSLGRAYHLDPGAAAIEVFADRILSDAEAA